MSEEPARYGNHDPVVTLRLELGRERDRAAAFEAALRKEVLAVIRQAAIDDKAGKEIERLKDCSRDVARQADAEIRSLKAEVYRLKLANAWQPIDTAPADGSMIVCLGPRGGVQVWVTANEKTPEQFLASGITHWMRIPKLEGGAS